jgi:uncharacterized protein YlxW (UPF0749 family)
MPERRRAAKTAPSRRVGSLRRSTRRLADHDEPQALDETTGSRGARSGPAGTDRPEGWPRLRASLLQPGRGQVIAAAMLFVVGLAGVMQIRINTADDTYTTARREDLIQLLDGLGAESRRLESEIAELEQTRTELQSGADTQRVAREEAEKRLTELSILAGTVPTEGTGIRMRIADPNAKVDAAVLLDAVQEMRDAGAEVIEVNDTIRVVGSSWFGTDAQGLVIDSKPVRRPITFEVIGDQHSLEEAARFRGGIISEITGPKIEGQVQIDRLDRVVIESLHGTSENQYARPASPPPTPR